MESCAVSLSPSRACSFPAVSCCVLPASPASCSVKEKTDERRMRHDDIVGKCVTRRLYFTSSLSLQLSSTSMMLMSLAMVR